MNSTRMPSRLASLCAAWLALLLPLPAQGDIVVSTIDFNGGTPSGLLRFDESTGVRLPAGDVPPLAVPNIGPRGPTDVAAGPGGALFMVDGFVGQILYFDGATGQPLPSPIPGAPDGLFTGLLEPPLQSLSFTSLTFGPDERLYVLDSYDVSGAGEGEPLKPGVRIYDSTNGAQLDTLLETADVEFAGPASLAFDNDGQLLLSDRDGGVIYQVDVEQDTIDPLVTAGPDGSPFTPTGMAVAPTGEIYVANLFGNSIVRYEADGSGGTLLAEIPPLPAPTPPGSNFPVDLMLDRDGNLLVAVLGAENPGEDGTAAGQVLRYDLSGTLLQTVAADLRPTSSLTLVPDLLPGDFDGNGTVDTQDYQVWTEAFGDEVPATNGADANGDGVVDTRDFTVWRDTLGATGMVAMAGASGTGVPEPASLLLLLCGAGTLALRRSRTR